MIANARNNPKTKGLFIGYDLSNAYCRVSYMQEGDFEPTDVVFSKEQNPHLIQNAICKRKGRDEWFVGSEAYETCLLGDGILTDKLLRLVSRSGRSTMDGVTYTGRELLLKFLEETLKVVFEAAKSSTVLGIMFTVSELDAAVFDALVDSMKTMGVDRSKVHIISHTESFMFYVLSQKKELWLNASVLYDCTGSGLHFYEMGILRGLKPNVAYAKHQFLEEGFSTDILATASGRKMADSILSACVDRMLSKRLISTCFLAGDGMDNCREWGTNFLRVLCQRRKVFFIENLFAKGAVYASMDMNREKTVYPYRFMCEGRIQVDITMEVQSNLSQQTVYLASAGANWYDTKAEISIIPDQTDNLEFKVRKIGEKNTEKIEMDIRELNTRGNKRTKIGVQLVFVSDNRFKITLTDQGFGEFFPPTDTCVEKEFTIE